MPPQDDLKRWFAARLSDTLPEYEVSSPEDDAEAVDAVRDADAAFGWIPPEALSGAQKLRWLHNPDAGPFFGYYYDELSAHPVTITNPRGIYFDHISHHILTFVLALSRGIPWYMEAQRRRVWDKDARKSPYIYLADATALINGVGGIGTRPPGCVWSWGWMLSASSHDRSTNCLTSSSTRPMNWIAFCPGRIS